MKEKCGCYTKVFVETNAEKIETFRVDVFYCPLHAAAPLMLEACKMAELLFVSIFDVYDVNTKNTVRKLRTAIAAAEPEEHNG